MTLQAWKVHTFAWLSREGLVIEREREVKKKEIAKEAKLLILFFMTPDFV